jgi:hypothetical protein
MHRSQPKDQSSLQDMIFIAQKKKKYHPEEALGYPQALASPFLMEHMLELPQGAD